MEWNSSVFFWEGAEGMRTKRQKQKAGCEKGEGGCVWAEKMGG